MCQMVMYLVWFPPVRLPYISITFRLFDFSLQIFKLTSKANMPVKSFRALFEFWMTVSLLTHRCVPSHFRCRAIWPRHQNCPPDVSIPTRKLNRTVNNQESHSKMAALNIGATIKLYVFICYLASFVSFVNNTVKCLCPGDSVAFAYWTDRLARLPPGPRLRQLRRIIDRVLSASPQQRVLILPLSLSGL